MKIPIVGGRAHHHGVSFYGKNYVVKALRSGSDIVIKMKPRKKIRNKLLIGRIPFFRGIIRLVEMLWLAGWLGKIFLFYFLFWLSFSPWQVWGSSLSDYKTWVITSLVLLWIRFTPIGQYHGAEHKVYNALENGNELSIEQVRAASRIAQNCGTNLVVIYFLMHTLLSFFLPVKLAFLIGFSVAWEIFRSKHKKWTAPLIAVGNGVQRYIVTVEPSDHQLEVAIQSMKHLIDIEKEAADISS